MASTFTNNNFYNFDHLLVSVYYCTCVAQAYSPNIGNNITFKQYADFSIGLLLLFSKTVDQVQKLFYFKNLLKYIFIKEQQQVTAIK